MVNETIRRMRKEITDKCTDHKMMHNALEKFHEAYYEHRNIVGSYRNAIGYESKMDERYKFMFKVAMGYIMSEQMKEGE